MSPFPPTCFNLQCVPPGSADRSTRGGGSPSVRRVGSPDSTCSVRAGLEEWGVLYRLHDPWSDYWLRGAPLDWLDAADRPVVDHAPRANGNDFAGYLSLAFAVGDPGVIIWDRRGALRMISVGSSVDLTRDPERRLGLNYVPDSFHPSPWYDHLPVMVRAINSDGALGAAWYVDNELSLSPLPEIDDGRFELLGPFAEVRWTSDAHP